MDHPDLEGKVVIVTGAAAGIGRAVAEAFLDAGLRVAAMDIDGDGVMALERRHGRRRLRGLRVDISDPDSCAGATAEALAHFGALHMLVNNAALGMNAVHPRYTTTDLQIEDVPDELWRRFMMVNACGLFFMSRQAVPVFRRQRWGRVINVGTSYFTMMRPGYAPYGPSKAVLEAWSLMLARELDGSGITVNVVIPGGPADTAMVLDEDGLDRGTLIPPALMAPPMLGLFGRAADTITGKRFLAVDWDPAIADPAAQKTRPIAWPELAVPLSTNPRKA